MFFVFVEEPTNWNGKINKSWKSPISGEYPSYNDHLSYGEDSGKKDSVVLFSYFLLAFFLFTLKRINAHEDLLLQIPTLFSPSPLMEICQLILIYLISIRREIKERIVFSVLQEPPNRKKQVTDSSASRRQVCTPDLGLFTFVRQASV